jgi:1,4-alpha-glucan branching enzyme
VYPDLHEASDRFIRLSRVHRGTQDPGLRRCLNQMGRELLLAQSSDWAFMISMGTTDEYARRRVTDHLRSFNGLMDGITRDSIDIETLEKLESSHFCLPRLDFECFA